MDKIYFALFYIVETTVLQRCIVAHLHLSSAAPSTMKLKAVSQGEKIFCQGEKFQSHSKHFPNIICGQMNK